MKPTLRTLDTETVLAQLEPACPESPIAEPPSPAAPAFIGTFSGRWHAGSPAPLNPKPTVSWVSEVTIGT